MTLAKATTTNKQHATTTTKTASNASSTAVPSFWTDPTLPWAIDMDGTLIKEDVTEVALDISLTDVRYWFYGVLALVLYYSGIFQITAYRLLERFVPVPPETLTYHTTLLDALQRHARAGGMVLLATASHVHAARKVARYVETKLSAENEAKGKPDFWFDDVLGSHPRILDGLWRSSSTSTTNNNNQTHASIWDACGAHKAHLIAARFPKGFVYAGNSADDLEVWSHDACRAMILVNCPDAVKQKAIKTIDKPYVVLD